MLFMEYIELLKGRRILKKGEIMDSMQDIVSHSSPIVLPLNAKRAPIARNPPVSRYYILRKNMVIRREYFLSLARIDYMVLRKESTRVSTRRPEFCITTERTCIYDADPSDGTALCSARNAIAVW